jgi:hypothetical protein
LFLDKFGFDIGKNRLADFKDFVVSLWVKTWEIEHGLRGIIGGLLDLFLGLR